MYYFMCEDGLRLNQDILFKKEKLAGGVILAFGARLLGAYL